MKHTARLLLFVQVGCRTPTRSHARHANAAPFDELTNATLMLDSETEMDTEQTIAEIECLERIFAVQDTRPLSRSDLSAANRRHDEMLEQSPWFRIWQRYGVCCRPEAPVITNVF